MTTKIIPANGDTFLYDDGTVWFCPDGPQGATFSTATNDTHTEEWEHDYNEANSIKDPSGNTYFEYSGGRPTGR